MRSTKKSLKRIIGLLMALAMTVCIFSAMALQTSAAALDGAVGTDLAKPFFNAYIDTGTTILIVLIVVLILVVIGAVVFVVIFLSKKKSNEQAVVPGPNMMPSPAPTNAQSFNHVQPNAQKPYAPAPQPLPVNPNAPQPVSFNSAAPAAPSAYQGDEGTSVLGVGSAGFTLLRKNGGEKVNINKAEFFIGKEKAKVDYCITNNNSISRRHCKIKVRAGKCYISDLGSTNCTYINGTKLSPNQEIALIPGDKIKLSNEEFEYLG